MSKFFSCILKDIRLLFGSGLRTLATLLLPILLIFVMFWGMSDIAHQGNRVPTFSVAIIDLDQTIMSAILIGQLEDVELFENVYILEDTGGTGDKLTLFNEYEVVAILTIPKDFFFSLYDMRNFTVEVVLNADMPIESAIFQSLTTSIMDIISENQQTMWAVHHLRYGELDAAQRSDLFRQASFLIVEDALGRQGIFPPDQVVIDDAVGTALFLYGSIMILFMLYIPLSILKTLPEELALGILPRYIATGGSALSFILSKWIAAFFLCFILWLPLTLAIFPFSFLKAFLVFFICFLGSVSMFLLLSTIIKDSSHSQIVGNVILFLFMVLGGGLYPIQMLPDTLHIFSRFTLSYYFIISLTGIGLNFSLVRIFGLLLPVLFVSIIFTGWSFMLLKYTCDRRPSLVKRSYLEKKGV
jgi:hypothetical protein